MSSSQRFNNQSLPIFENLCPKRYDIQDIVDATQTLQMALSLNQLHVQRAQNIKVLG